MWDNPSLSARMAVCVNVPAMTVTPPFSFSAAAVDVALSDTDQDPIEVS